MSDEEVPVEPKAGGWPNWVRQWVLPFVEEAGLAPVLAAMLGHTMVIIGPLLLTLGRGGVAASLPLTVLVMGSVWLVQTEREENDGRSGNVAVVVALTWSLSLGFAVLAGRTGIL